MEDSHLLNTIVFLRRRAPAYKRAVQDHLIAEECAGWRMLCHVQGEHAQDAIESGLDQVDREIAYVQLASPQELLEARPIYRSLIREARRRGLREP
jgi:hypothetical protein